jgi:hypothetical protein
VTASTAGSGFLVSRSDLRITKAVQTNAAGAQRDSDVLLRVDKFGLTANNITYAVHGQDMRYWDFFPGPEGWSHLPVWGFGEVIESRAAGINAGERFYGYYPTSAYATFRVDPTGSGFTEVSKHRQGLAGAYNQYLRTTDDAAYDPEYEDEQMIIRPLFMTSFLLADFLSLNGNFGAKSTILSSASSKTALSLAFLLSREPNRAPVVGLTSEANVGFCETTGYYDRVVAYDDIDSLEREDAAYIDMSGSSKVRAAVHAHFADRLKHSSVVGDTHWDEEKTPAELPGPRPQFFFAPNHMSRRAADWGEGGLHQHFAAAWKEFRGTLRDWMQIVREEGSEALGNRYIELLEGSTDPSHAYVLSLNPGSAS